MFYFEMQYFNLNCIVDVSHAAPSSSHESSHRASTMDAFVSNKN